MERDVEHNVEQNDHTTPDLTVVGIGASAGGLEALRRFLEATPDNTGMAFVVVVHLSPEHESHLPSLLQSHTMMPVTQVTDSLPTPIERDHVYVIPPNRNLSTIDTHLRFSELEERRRERAPIDHFFRTLSETHDGESIGIILSGTGSDGTVGIKRIKERGGLTVAQEPSDAAYDGMPQSAIGTGMVDLVLPVDEIPARIVEYAQVRPRVAVPSEGEEVEGDAKEALQKIFAQLRVQTGHDFSHYKRSTLMRRIGRRMQLHQVEELNDYLRVLRTGRGEVEALFNDLLITVTNFFRDSQAFDVLEKEIIPEILADKGAEDAVRVWVAGCATGEEAYSVAMLLLEQAMRMEHVPEIQVFATDISERALLRARDGLYPDVIATDVSPERLKRFFVQEQGGYRVRKELREVVLFAPHNLLKDPPFSKVDLITCRNLLIYLRRNVQQQIFELFHYALKPNGYLFLGLSETVDGAELFRTLNKKQGLSQRQNGLGGEPRLPSLPLGPPRVAPLTVAAGDGSGGDGSVHGSGDGSEPERSAASGSFGSLHARMVEQYAPPSVLVNDDYNIVHLSEHAGRYLQQPGGEPTHNILKRVHPELRIELTTALYGAFEKGRASHSPPISVRIEGAARRVILNVQSATAPELARYVLVSFNESDELESESDEDERAAQSDATVRELEEELGYTKQRMRTTVEEFETSKEEMRASNEELQSMNEELKSTAEELETSREELQSMNEELVTVNQENKNKVEELSALTDDLRNLLSATDIATLFLDRDLCIKRFTPKVSELFNILHSDRGRPLGDITHKLGDGDLLREAEQVLKKLVPIEREIESEAGRCYLMRVLPYRTLEDRIDGVVMTFVELTRIKAGGARAAPERRALPAAGGEREGVRHLYDGPRREPSPAGTQARRRRWAGRRRRPWGNRASLSLPWRTMASALSTRWRHPPPRGMPIDERWHVRKDGSRFWANGTMFALRDEAGTLRGFAKLLRDETERRQATAALAEQTNLFHTTLSTVSDFIYTFDRRGRFVFVNQPLLDLWGLKLEEARGKTFFELPYPDDLATKLHEQVQQVFQTGRSLKDETPYTNPAEKSGYYEYIFTPVLAADGSVEMVAGSTRDLSERKRIEEALRESEERYRLTVENVDEYAIFTMDEAGRIASWNMGAKQTLGWTEEEAIGQSGDIHLYAGRPRAEPLRRGAAARAGDRQTRPTSAGTCAGTAAASGPTAS